MRMGLYNIGMGLCSIGMGLSLLLLLLQPLPPGWDKGYCSQTNKRFFFNSELKLSLWDYEEVLVYSKNGDKVRSVNIIND